MYLATQFHCCYFQHIQSWNFHQCEQQVAFGFLEVVSLGKQRAQIHCVECVLYIADQFFKLLWCVMVINDSTWFLAVSCVHNQMTRAKQVKVVASYIWQLGEEIYGSPSTVIYCCLVFCICWSIVIAISAQMWRFLMPNTISGTTNYYIPEKWPSGMYVCNSIYAPSFFWMYYHLTFEQT